MIASSANRTALFIDGANLYLIAKALGLDIDYKRLLKEFQSHGTPGRAFYYTAVTEDQEFSSVRPPLDWLVYNDFTAVNQACQGFYRRQRQPPMIADELRRQADVFTDLADLQCRVRIRSSAQLPAKPVRIQRITLTGARLWRGGQMPQNFKG